MRPWLALLLLTACDPTSTLVLDLRTDLEPGLEFDRVEADITTADGATFEVRVPVEEADYGRGVRLAELDSLMPGSVRIEGRLLLGDELTAERPLIAELSEGRFGISLLLTKSCFGVTCSDAELTCVGQRCVEPTCAPENPDSCFDEPQCEVDGDCTAPDCATPICAEGVCLSVPDTQACLEDEVCLLSAGCAEVRRGGYGEPTLLEGIPVRADDPSPSLDELTLWFNHAGDIWVATRPSVDAPFEGAAIVTEVSVEMQSESNPVVAPDERTLVFARNDVMTELASIWISRRASVADAWGAPEMLTVSAGVEDAHPFSITADGLTLVYGDNEDVLELATRVTVDDVFDTPAVFDGFEEPPFRPANAVFIDGGLGLIFTLGAVRQQDLFEARRASLGVPFGAPVALEALNTGASDSDPYLSSDGSTLYFSSSRLNGTTLNLFTATRN